jgi:glucitol/sorbitol PTS system EIIA component
VITVLAVGEVADENLVNLGHLSLKRNGEHVAALPGDVCCDEGPIPPIAPGDEIRIVPGSGRSSP